MAELAYQVVIKKIKNAIDTQQYDNMRLPDERTLAQVYQVSRSTIKRALNILANQGIIFKKRGSGTFINPLYLKNTAFLQYTGNNLGVTDSFRQGDQKPSIQLLDFKVIPASADIQRDLFLKKDDFVYKIERLRLLNQKPFMIETGYIPIKIVPELTREVVSASIFNYLQDEKKQEVTKAFLSIYAKPSTPQEQNQLGLKKNEPTGIMEGIFFLDDGTPFEFSTMKLHYQYMRYNTFVSVSNRD